MKLCLLLLLLAFGLAKAQTASDFKLDSLRRAAETVKSDTARALTQSRLAAALLQASKYAEAEAAARKGLDISRRASFLKGEAENLFRLGIIHGQQGKLREAQPYYKGSLRLFQRLGNQRGVGLAGNNLGALHNALGQLDSALYYYVLTKRAFLQSDDSTMAAYPLINMSNHYKQMGDLPQALRSLQLAYRLLEKRGEQEAIASALVSIGWLYVEWGDHAKAQINFDKAVDLLDSCQCAPYSLVHALISAGKSHAALRRPDEERACYQRAFHLADSLERWSALAQASICLSEFHAYRRQFDAARRYLKRGEEAARLSQEVSVIGAIDNSWGYLFFQEGRMDSSRRHFEAALRVFEEMEDKGSQIAVLEKLARADSAVGDFRAALAHYKRYRVLDDSVRSDKNAREVGRLEAQFEAQKAMEVQKAERAAEKSRNHWMLGSAGGGLLLMLVIAFTLFRGRQREKKANAALRALNEEIQHRKSEIEAMNAELQATLTEVNDQRTALEIQHEKIEDSIRYASRIQQAILPSESQIQEALPRHFIHYQPRDIVSGDFYWMTRLGGLTFFAVVDCTGHGVPGAFMSVLGSNLLHQIVDESQVAAPEAILKELDRRIAETLRQQYGSDSKDGMDVCLLMLHEAGPDGNRVVEYAGAGRPLWHLQAGRVTEYKSAKYACGGSQHADKCYPAHRIEVQAGDRLYAFTDGVGDQFGGADERARKLGSARLQSFLAHTAALPVGAQGQAFSSFFAEWTGNRKQLDDVLLVGIEV